MRRIATLLVLAACAGGGDDTGDPFAADACEAVEAPAVGDLPDHASWESSEREYATGLGWGDVDGDGLDDLVVASGNDMVRGPVSVHFGRDDGTVPSEPDAVGSAEHYHGHLALGDLDRDGFDDAVVARFLGDARFLDPGGVDVYYGSPDGLGAQPDWRVDGFHTFALALGDADGDGDLDLAVAVGEPYYADEDVDRLYLNDGGAFADEPAWTSADAAHSLDVAFLDHDGDGDLDLAFARHGAPHARYDNDGGFGDLPSWEAPGDSFDGNTLDFGDVDGDGAPDLLVSDTLDGDGRVRLYCGEPWAECWRSETVQRWYSAVSLIDVDGDADLDAVAGSWWGPVEVFEHDGIGLEPLPDYVSARTSVVEAFAWRDLDGAHDVATCVEGTGLIEIPRGARVTAVSPPAAVSDGYVSTEPGQTVQVRWVLSGQLDLAVSNWEPERGTWIFAR